MSTRRSASRPASVSGRRSDSCSRAWQATDLWTSIGRWTPKTLTSLPGGRRGETCASETSAGAWISCSRAESWPNAPCRAKSCANSAPATTARLSQCSRKRPRLFPGVLNRVQHLLHVTCHLHLVPPPRHRAVAANQVSSANVPHVLLAKERLLLPYAVFLCNSMVGICQER